MRKHRLWNVLLLGSCSVCLVAVAFVASCALRGESGRSIAAVLDRKGKVILVDLESGQVVKTRRLRSWAFDIAADSSNGTFVTAQSGGADVDADNKVGIIPVDVLSPVRYVTLPRANPYGIEVIGDGKVIADHGWMDDKGMWVSVVDTNQRKVIKTGHVPDLNISLRQVNGMLWASCTDLDGRDTLRRVHPDTLRSEALLAGSDFPVVETSGPKGLYGWLIPEPGKGVLARFNAKTGAVETTKAIELDDGAGRMLYCRGRVIAADYAEMDLALPGTRLFVYDPETLEIERTIRVSGGPCDMAVWRDRIVVGNFLDQQLLVIDPATGKTEKTIELPKMTKLPFQVAVMD